MVFQHHHLTYLKLLGIGGTSEVSCVRHRKGKTFALKRLLPHLRDDPEMRSLLMLEGVHLSSVKSPYVVRCLSILTTPISKDETHSSRGTSPQTDTKDQETNIKDSEEISVLMSYVDGVHLRALLRYMKRDHQILKPVIIAHIIESIFEGLKALHYATSPTGRPLSITHNDLSPTNIMISRTGRVILTDLSSAWSRLGPSSGVPRPGKKAYLSPQRRAGERGGPSGDLFALGCIWFELITGAPPQENLFVSSGILRGAGWPKEWARVVSDLLSPNPTRRWICYEELRVDQIWCQTLFKEERQKYKKQGKTSLSSLIHELSSAL